MYSSDADREGIAEASFLSAKQLKKNFGFHSIHARKEKVLIAVQKATEIWKNVEELARIKERAVLQNLGVEISESESSETQAVKVTMMVGVQMQAPTTINLHWLCR